MASAGVGINGRAARLRHGFASNLQRQTRTVMPRSLGSQMEFRRDAEPGHRSHRVGSVQSMLDTDV